MLLAISHLKTDPDTLASAYAMSRAKDIPYFVPDTTNVAVKMILSTYTEKAPITVDSISKDMHLALLDFHSSISLHPMLRENPIDIIIDHHEEGDLVAPQMIIDPIGATSTLVGEMIKDIPKDVALLIGFGICDDTAGGILHATQRDIDMLKRVERISGKSKSWFMNKLKEAYMEGFLVDSDTREYHIGGYTIIIGQFRSPGALSSEKIFREISQYVYSLNGDLALYIISDPAQNATHIIGKVEKHELAPLIGKLAGRHKLLSRKVDVLPYIREYIQHISRNSENRQ